MFFASQPAALAIVEEAPPRRLGCAPRADEVSCRTRVLGSRFWRLSGRSTRQRVARLPDARRRSMQFLSAAELPGQLEHCDRGQLAVAMQGHSGRERGGCLAPAAECPASAGARALPSEAEALRLRPLPAFARLVFWAPRQARLQRRASSVEESISSARLMQSCVPRRSSPRSSVSCPPAATPVGR
jgi:hypothetical protein